MRYLFPAKTLCAFSERNKFWTYGIFILCFFLTIMRGYFKESGLNPYVVINFFDKWSGFTKEIFVIVVKFLYTPIGVTIWLLFVFGLFLWFLYIGSGKKKSLKFKEFFFPFLCLSYPGLLIGVISLLLLIVPAQIPYLVRLCIFFYWFSFYCALMIQEYRVKPIRSIGVILLSFLFVFPLGGFPIIAPYLQWI